MTSGAFAIKAETGQWIGACQAKKIFCDSALRQIKRHRRTREKEAEAGRCARKNDTRMRMPPGIMSQKSKIEYLESCHTCYPSRNRDGRSAMIEVSDALGWDRKHAIKALNGKASLGQGARKPGSKAISTEADKEVILEIWKRSEQPCGKRLKPTLPLWLDSYETHPGPLPAETCRKILQYSAPKP